MAPPTRTPDATTLRRWRDKGYTQEQMVELTLQEFGAVVSRSGIAAAMARNGLSETGARYPDEVPWRINPIHATSNPLRMLRLLGRRREGKRLNRRETEQLDSWLDTLEEKNLIVAYERWSRIPLHLSGIQRQRW